MANLLQSGLMVHCCQELVDMADSGMETEEFEEESDDEIDFSPSQF